MHQVTLPPFDPFPTEMAHRYQTQHLRTIAMNYMLKQVAPFLGRLDQAMLFLFTTFVKQRDYVTRTEGFQELSPDLLHEFKQNGAEERHVSFLLGSRLIWVLVSGLPKNVQGHCTRAHIRG